MNKSTGIIIVLIIIALGVWLMTRDSSMDTNVQPSTTAETGSTTKETQENTDFSDAALNQSASAIDAQLDILSTETTDAQSAE
jgi:hypothetical protein